MGCAMFCPSVEPEQGYKDCRSMSDGEKMGMQQAQERGRRVSVSAECMSLESDRKDSYVKVNHPKSEEEYERIRSSVERILLFQNATEKDLRELLDAMFEKKVAAGEDVITQGDEGDFFYVVDSGELDVYVSTKPDPVFHYGPGQTFGELALMYNSPRAATVKACTDCVLWALDRDTFRYIVLSNTKKAKEGQEAILKKVDLLSTLSPSQYSMIADALYPVHYPKEEIIIHQDDDDLDNFLFYILTEGRCRFEFTKNEQTTTVGTVKAGEYFGEKGLIGSDSRAVSVVADTDITCLVMDRATFERLMGPLADILQEKITKYQDAEKLHDMSH